MGANGSRRAAGRTTDAPTTSAKERLLNAAAIVLWPFLLPIAARRATRPFDLIHQSMLPTFHDGDRILVLLLEHCGTPPLVRNDFVVFESWHDDEDFALKRIIACPGQTIAIDRHVVFVDGEPLDEPYATGPTHGAVPPKRLGPDEYFVMGDNRTQSCDSRAHGPIRLAAVYGRPLYRFWPPRRMGFVYREMEEE